MCALESLLFLAFASDSDVEGIACNETSSDMIEGQEPWRRPPAEMPSTPH
jgi:hypothetical protein